MTSVGVLRALVVVSVALVGFIRQSSAGDGGIMVTDTSRLHPSFGLNGEYDTNVGYRPAGEEVGDLILHFKPGLAFESSSKSLKFNLGAVGDYNKYFGVKVPATKELSTFAGAVDLGLAVNPRGKVTFSVSDKVARTTEPQNYSLMGRYDRWDNDLQADLRISPGGGALSFEFSGGLAVSYYDSEDLTGNNFISPTGRFLAKWKFFPRTAFTISSSYEGRKYVGDRNIYYQNLDSNGLRADAAIVGQITPRFSAMISAGYGNSFISSGADDFNSVIGRVEGSYALDPNSNIRLGFQRDFTNVGIYQYASDNRLYLDTHMSFLNNRARVLFGATFDYLVYGDPVQITDPQNPQADVPPGRNDPLVDGRLALEFDLLKWLSTGLGYSLRVNATGYETEVQTEAGQELVSAKFLKHMFSFQISAYY